MEISPCSYTINFKYTLYIVQFRIQAHFTANTFKILLNRVTYSDPSSFLHPDRRWCTDSLCSPHNLHLSHSTDPLIFFHVLVSIICSRSENIYGVFVGYISTSQSLLPYITLVFHSEAPSLPNFVVYSLSFSLFKIFFIFFHPFFHSV